MGIIFSEETKKKMSENNARKGKPGTMLGKKMGPSWNKNIPHSEEHKEKLRKAWEKRKVEKPHTEATRKKMSESMKRACATEETINKRKLALTKRLLIICPHCGVQNYNKGSMVVSHFDNCRKNPNFDHEAAAIKKKETRIKRDFALTLRPLLTCPRCKHKGYNKGNMVMNHFNNCKYVLS